MREIHVHIDSITTDQGKELVGKLALTWQEGEIVALTGSSGAGKSIICKFISGILPENLHATGYVSYISDEGRQELSTKSEKERTAWNAGKMVYLTQETDLAFNPLRKISKSFRDALSLAGKPNERSQMDRWFEAVELGPDMLDRFPHELSGGQVQRALLAIALATGARWIIADEPTSNLDKLTQKKIIELMIRLQKSEKLGLLLVTHDVSLSKTLATKSIVVGDLKPPSCKLQPLDPVGKENLLDVSGLGFDYRAKGWGRRVPILRDIDLTVHPGEWVGVIGSSGGGKSTLAKVITRLIPLQQGSIIFRGEPVRSMSRNAQSNAIQLVFQNPYTSLNPRLPVLEQLKDAIVPSEINNEPWKPLLAAFGLEGLALDRLPGYYSGGERQRLAIIRALLKQPQLLIADEAISSLDEDNQYQTLHTLQHITGTSQLSVLFISHDITWMQQVCNRLYVLDQGRIVESGPTPSMLSNPKNPVTMALLDAANGKI
ncbi:MAG: ABC transporter ATP-binding protein [Saprospiraceae bacterium]|nr:ABC transporter ATP-binding protein [Saprospiraceae bacterium]MCB9319349.1 ABC transporter ATP-binding protein [Lewinellaceae bacterium]